MAETLSWSLVEASGCVSVSVAVAAASMNDLEVDIAQDHLIVRDRNGAHSLNLPHPVDPDVCTVKFKTKSQELKFTLPRADGHEKSEKAAQQHTFDLMASSVATVLEAAACKPEPRSDSSTATTASKADARDIARVGASLNASPGVPVAAGCEPQHTHPDNQVAAMLGELHEGRETTMILDSEGDAAFSELRALLAEGPTSLKDGVRRRVADGRINLAFCIVLRVNIGNALDAGQQNKVSAFRWIQKEIRACLTAPPKVSGQEHAPHVDTSVQAAPRPVEPHEVLDAKPLKELVAANVDKKGSKVRGIRSRAAQLAEQVGTCLSSNGWAVLDGLFTDSGAADLRCEMEKLEPHFHASEIWVGHQAAVGAQMTVPEIRGDKILWMCGHHPKRSDTPWSHSNGTQSAEDFEPGADAGALQPCSSTVRQEMRDMAMKSGGARRIQPSERWINRNLARMLDALDALVLELRRSPSAGRCSNLDDRSDAMLAIYPANGTRFQRHVDNTAGDGRRLTCLCYMNKDWKASDGGELCVYPRGATPVSILPTAGRIVLLHADSMPHEVRPAYRHRYSVNVWYYDKEERDHAVEEARSTGRIGGHGGAVTDADQAAARSLLQSVLNGHGTATLDEISRLADEAEALPAGAAHMVAQVTMGSAAGKETTPADVARGLRAMSPEALQALRQGMNLMSHS